LITLAIQDANEQYAGSEGHIFLPHSASERLKIFCFLAFGSIRSGPRSK
jgi:hypothetical protein